MINPMELTGKTILISGATGGIGSVTAQRLAELGARIMLFDMRENRLKDLLRELPGEGHRAYQMNLRTPEDIAPAVEQICGEAGMLHGFVHCAGVAPMRPFKMTRNEDITWPMQVNFISFVEIVRTLTAKKNRFADGGSIVAMSSTAAIHGKPTKLAYSASKAALDAAIRCMICDLQKRQIRINSVMPSWVQTNMLDEFLRDYPDSRDVIELREKQFMGITDPLEVANTIAFLLSDATKTITGASILMDGGILQG